MLFWRQDGKSLRLAHFDLLGLFVLHPGRSALWAGGQHTAFARMQNLFDTNSYSDEDRVRTERYLAEKSRTELSAGIDNYDDYLKALGMKAVCAPFDAFHIPRIAQLTQRSNQFNLRTVRYSEQEIEEIAANPRYVTRYYTLRDRFGEHGLIAVVILEKRENELFVNEWLMSCRVLKRGMEQYPGGNR